MLGLGIGLTQVAVLRAGGFSPAALFGNGEKGYVSDIAALFQDVAGVVPASAAGQLVAFGRGATGGNAVQADAGKRPVYAVVPSTGHRNFAIGSAHVAEEAYWSTSKTVNGIVTTKIGYGIDTDGFDYADFSVVGTASSTAAINLYTRTASRTPAAAGQSWTASAIVSRIGGSAAPAQSGIRVEVIGEQAPATILGSFNGATVDPATEAVITVTAPLADPATNQVTGTVSARIQGGQRSTRPTASRRFRLSRAPQGRGFSV